MSQTNDAKNDDKKKKDVAQDDNARKDDAPQLGHFLDYDRHWLQAIELLKFQLRTKKNNKHFNTLEMFYYEKLEDSFEKLENRTYFETRIANNLFYGLSNEFSVVPYTIPKSNLGLRQYKFMTCPMRVLYYAIGVYLLELVQEYLKDYRSHKHIRSNYGGNLGLEKEELIPNPDRIYYKSYYQEFRRRLRKEIRAKTEQKVVVHLDIENYFDELKIPKLVELLKQYIKESIQKKMNYGEATQGQLVSFFDFLAGGKSGIPQSNNNVISSFIGHLFLTFGDLYLDNQLSKQDDSVDSYKIIRYMDDVYISIVFKEKDSISRTKFLHSLAPRISDCLYEHLGLRLNLKTRLFQLKDPCDKAELQRNLKRVSREFEIADEEKDEPPLDKIDNIIKQLNRLKCSGIDPYFQRHNELDAEMLKEVYDKKVQQMLQMSTTKARLKSVFLGSGGFDFELVNADPAPIIILILACEVVPQEFEKFLGSKKRLTSRDIALVLSYLCQIGFTSDRLVDRLARNPQMEEIMKIFQDGQLPSKSLGYYELTEAQTLKIARCCQSYVFEQIRLRVLFERKAEYSVALNHLLNEIHAICGVLDEKAKGAKKYDADDVNDYLKSQNVPHDTRIKVWKLFDRRNKSTVPHADPFAWAVKKDAYFDYRSHVGDCLKHLL